MLVYSFLLGVWESHFTLYWSSWWFFLKTKPCASFITVQPPGSNFETPGNNFGFSVGNTYVWSLEFLWALTRALLVRPGQFPLILLWISWHRLSYEAWTPTSSTGFCCQTAVVKPLGYLALSIAYKHLWKLEKALLNSCCFFVIFYNVNY